MAQDPPAETTASPAPKPPPPPNPVWLAFRSLKRFAVTPTGSVVLSLSLMLVVAALWVVWPWVSAGGEIGSGLDRQPSRLWGEARVLEPGQGITAGELAADLDALGFSRIPSDPEAEVRPATYQVADGAVTLHLPERVTPTGRRRAETVVVRFDGRPAGDEGEGEENGEGGDGESADGGPGVILADEDGDALDEPVFLGAPLLASYYGEEVREIYPVRIDDLPPHVVQAVLAAEDHGFYFHDGVSPVGMARAAVVNARSGGVAQGGSTITQQLVKNIYLSPERSYLRKAREAVLALIIEQTHPKPAILQAYLNQIYWGNAHGLNFHGIGSAALHFFGVGPTDLTVSQAATLAGMIRSPGGNNPIEHPEASRERRNQVITAMEELKYIDAEEAEAARDEPIRTVGLDLRTRQAPYFADAVAAEAAERFGLDTLGDHGYHIFTTLDPAEQKAAEEAVSRTLARLPARSRLQGALISVDPRDGRVTAWVGGRDYEDSEFDRVSSAKRQAGSAFKPVVLAAALAGGAFNPTSRLDDSPLTLDNDGVPWTPKNYDGRFRGPVSVRRAIVESLNIPTVRMAQEVGWGAIASMAEELGIDSEIQERPSMSLGAFEVTPLELARVYATFAAGGVRPVIHGIAAVTRADGDVVGRAEPPEGDEVLDPVVAYRVTSILRGVVESGTGRGVGRYGVAGPLAAKTGTSNEARDNWFAIYRPDRVTVTWVGHDEPQPTPLSGAQAALPVWGRYAAAGYPKSPPEPGPPPEGIALVEVCAESGRVPRPWCPTVEEALLEGEAPSELCDVHARAPAPEIRDGGGRGNRPGPLGRAKRKLKKIFG